MLDYTVMIDPVSGEERLETSLQGKALLTIPQLNKSTAFTRREREAFGLVGKLPIQVEDLDAQVARAYQQYLHYQTDLQRNIYLNNLHDKNQILFYRLVQDHIAEMIPLIYTPIVGNAVKRFSQEFRQARGLYISYPESYDITELLNNRTNPEIDLIVVSDGEGVLGIGDQGVGAIDIPIAKLMVYSLFGGINPNRTLPIILDVGTNNQELLNDPFYLGWRHPRISGDEYHAFIERFIESIEKNFPWVFLHYEDFGRENARATLDKFRHRLCSFNDDIQGTGVATVAALLTACELNQRSLTEQTIVVFGAGTAGMGITEQIYDAMCRQGADPEMARRRFWLVDRFGIVHQEQEHLTPSQRVFARPQSDLEGFNLTGNSQSELAELIHQVHPTVLIGCSAQRNAFSREMIEEMARHTARPIIFPLSNPTSMCEATPENLIYWTKGRALIATGSPFDDVHFEQKTFRIAQCNNALVFPGIGLGVISVAAKELTNEMIWAAVQAITATALKEASQTGALLPALTEAASLATDIAFAVAKEAMQAGLATKPNLPSDHEALLTLIKKQRWYPHYLPYFYRPMK